MLPLADAAAQEDVIVARGSTHPGVKFVLKQFPGCVPSSTPDHDSQHVVAPSASQHPHDGRIVCSTRWVHRLVLQTERAVVRPAC